MLVKEITNTGCLQPSSFSIPLVPGVVQLSLKTGQLCLEIFDTGLGAEPLISERHLLPLGPLALLLEILYLTLKFGYTIDVGGPVTSAIIDAAQFHLPFPHHFVVGT
jgi:hypothetical protein